MEKTPKCQKSYHVKKNDLVEVICGDWKGEKGKILAILKKKDRVVLELQNLSDAKKQRIGMRTVKKSKAAPQGGMVERSVSTHVSNVKKIEQAEAEAKAE